jgi:hypothetical protein
VYEQANILFAKLQNDEPIIIKEANTGSGAVVDPDASASPKPSASASPSAAPSVDPNEPDWRGTNAGTTTCSG